MKTNRHPEKGNISVPLGSSLILGAPNLELFLGEPNLELFLGEAETKS